MKEKWPRCVISRADRKISQGIYNCTVQREQAEQKQITRNTVSIAYSPTLISVS